MIGFKTKRSLAIGRLVCIFILTMALSCFTIEKVECLKIFRANTPPSTSGAYWTPRNDYPLINLAKGSYYEIVQENWSITDGTLLYLRMGNGDIASVWKSSGCAYTKR